MTRFTYSNTFAFCQAQSEEAELIEVSPTVVFTNSPSGRESMSPGVTTSDGLDNDVCLGEDNDAGELHFLPSYNAFSK